MDRALYKKTELEGVRDQLTEFCYVEVGMDLFGSLGSAVHAKSEESMIKKWRRVAVPNHK